MRWFAVVMLLSSTIALSLLPATAQEATPAADCPATTPEENKEIARQWFATVTEGSGEEAAALTAPDVIYHDAAPDSEPMVGGAAEWVNRRFQDYPDFQATVEHIVAEDDMVATYNWFSGTHQGDQEDALGVPGTGMQSEWVSMVLFRIECGKIAELWSVTDNLGRLQRLGAITDEELSSVEPVATPAS